MSKSIADAIRALGENNEEVYSVVGTVIAIDEDKLTCDCAPTSGGAIIYDVLLQAMEGQATGFVLIPMIGSSVIVTFISSVSAYVGATSNIQKMQCIVSGKEVNLTQGGIEIKAGFTNITVNDNGVSIVRAGISLVDVLSQLIDAIMAITVGTPSGPSTPPVNVAQFAVVKSQLIQILS